MDVYYESLCPDSRNFLVNQLASNWNVLSSFVNLRLIPFGKASVRLLYTSRYYLFLQYKIVG